MNPIEANGDLVFQPVPKCFLSARNSIVEVGIMARIYNERFGLVRVAEVWFLRNKSNACRVCGFCLN